MRMPWQSCVALTKNLRSDHNITPIAVPSQGMQLLERFRQFIATEHLFTPQSNLLLAISGGLDSAVLLDLCSKAGYRAELLHCNFQLRATESERDEQFVRDLARRYDLPVSVRAFDTMAYAEQQKLSVQVAARELRYQWFEEKRQASLSPAWIVTAHHLDDNIETSLYNYFKGTGIAGLRGMLPLRDHIARPLLFATRAELEEYATGQGLSWVEDSSNASDKYARNYLRHQLIPVVRQLFPGVEQQLADNLQRLRETELIYREAIQRIHGSLLVQKKGELHIPVLKLQQQTAPRTVLYELIKEYGFSSAQTEEVWSLCERETGHYVASATHRIIRNRAWLILAPLPAGTDSWLLIEKPGTYQCAQGTITLQWQPVSAGDTLPADPHTAWINAQELHFPLLLRTWKQGDYFYPLGMPKKKKVARFFIDQKLSKTQKEKAVVLEMDKKILWLPGLRLDHRFRVEPATQKVLAVHWQPH